MAIDLTSDFHVLAATIDGEAEGEPLAGKQAVASSILNRVALSKVHSHFGDGTIRGACLAHAQFDCWMPGPDCDRINALEFEHPSPGLQDCMDVANEAIQGALTDPTGGSTHYYDHGILGPMWLVGAKWCGQFGRQLFWKNVK